MRSIPNIIHKELQTRFRVLLNEDIFFRNVILHILSEGTAYIIGGFIRDVFEEKRSRDIDIVVNLSHDRLIEIVEGETRDYQLNRFGGVKLVLKGIIADLWSFDSNWAFKNKVVKYNENEILNSLAKGCFFNYDALVVNAINFTYNTKFYENFLENKELDILQKRALYKNLNPSLEANIIKAVYIKKKYDASLSVNLKEYINKKTKYLNDMYGDALKRLMEIKDSYPKFEIINESDIVDVLNDVKDSVPKTLFD